MHPSSIPLPMPEPAAATVGQGTRGGLLLAAAMLLTMPLVAFQGPAHTTPMDAANVLFLAVSWMLILARREPITFPLALPFWVMMVASVVALYTADYRARAALVIGVDVYLYLWFVTLAHFLARRCDLGRVAELWTAVACVVALLTLGDAYLGLAGGRFAATSRATGTFDSPNMFGDYLVVSFFVAWAAAAAGQRRLLYLGLPVLFAGMRSTASNGALVSLLGGCAAMAVASPWLWRPRTLGTLLVTAGMVVAVVGIWHTELEDLATRRLSGGRTEVGGAALKGASERLPVWQTGLQFVFETPTGIGPGNFSLVNAVETGDYHGAHNEYIGMLVERGPLGLLGWLGVLASVAAMVFQIRRGARAGFAPLGVLPLFGLVGAIAAHALVIELSHFRHFWMVLAVVAALAVQARAAMADTERSVA